MKYIEFNVKHPKCVHCFISERAYASVISEVMMNGKNETGGVFLGYILGTAWYIVEAIDPGMNTVNQVAFFQWDKDYVNHQASKLSQIYKHPLTVLGFWHRHPQDMNYFSSTDERTILENLRELKQGLISMLVNVDPKLRMTYYYCYGDDIMKIRYDVGNEYFPVELMQYADSEEFSNRAAKRGERLEVLYEQVLNPKTLYGKKTVSANQTTTPSPSPDTAHSPKEREPEPSSSKETYQQLEERIENLSRTLNITLQTMNDLKTELKDYKKLLKKNSKKTWL